LKTKKKEKIFEDKKEEEADMVQKIDTFKMPEQLVNGPRTIEVNERPSSQDNFGRQIPDQ
jgi:hypothetical protein